MNARQITRGFPAIVIALIAILVFAAPAFAQSEHPPAPPPPPDAGPAAPTTPPPAGDEDHPAPASLVAQAGPPSPWILIGGTVRTFTTIQGALDAISSEGLTPTDRAVHIDAGAFTETLVSLNGANPFLGQLQKMEGNCDNATRACNPSDPNQTVLNGSLAINNTRLGFTLQGMTVNGYVVFDNNTGALQLKSLIVQNTAGNGITVTNQKGPITLDTVASNGNAGYGAYLNNAGVIAPVTVRSSAFDGNGLYTQRTVASLTIVTRGVILIDGVSANDNNSDGAAVQTPAALTVRNTRLEGNKKVMSGSDTIASGHGLMISPNEPPVSIVMDSLYVNHNEGVGLFLKSKGAITLDNLLVNGNGHEGLIVCSDYPCRWDLYSILPGAASLLVRNSTFSKNRSGAQVDVKGPVTMLNTEYSDNTGADGVNIHATGTVFFNHMRANNNFAAGAHIEISGQYARGNLIMLYTLGANEFSGNKGGDGLTAFVQGSINLNEVNAHNNHTNGLYLITPSPYGQGIALFSVRAYSNGQAGMILAGRGLVSLKLAGAVGNGRDTGSDRGGGALIDNTPGAIFPVILTDVWFDDNQDGSGLAVWSKGPILLTDLRSASGNSGNGVYLDTTDGTAPVSVNRITPYDHNLFGYNSGAGLAVFSKGAVSLNRILAIHNGNNGIYVDNCLFDQALNRCTGAGPVTLTSSPDYMNVFEHNGASGIFVRSAGVITISRIEANDNGDCGALLFNENASIPLPVMVTIGRFDDNANSGLYVSSKGHITLVDVDARNNDTYYGFLPFGNIKGGSVDERLVGRHALTGDRYNFTVTVDLTIISISLAPTFSATLQLYKWDPSSKTFTFMTAWDGTGALPIEVTQQVSLGTYQIRIVGQDANQFGNYTLSLNDPDPSHSDVMGYGANGLKLFNAYPGATGGVTIKSASITGTNDLSNNSGKGLLIYTNGPVAINNVTANNNGGQGALIRNDDAPFAPLVTISAITKWNEFNENGKDGLTVISKGAITLTNVDAVGNSGTGVSLNNEIGAAGVTYRTHTATIYNAVQNNSGDGLVILSRGAIFISKVSAHDNRGIGAHLSNASTGFPFGITVLDSGFNRNLGGNGLTVTSRGTITLNAVFANENSEDGANLDNVTGGYPNPVTLINATFERNGGDGVEVDSLGNIVANNVVAISNAICGADIDNRYRGGIGTVTVTGIDGKSRFSNNSDTGLLILSNKNILVNMTVVEKNGKHGFDLSGDAAVTLTHSKAQYNGLNGILIIGVGDIVLFNIKSVNNGSQAADPLNPVLQNANGALLVTTNGNVRVNNSAFMGHRSAGIHYSVIAGKSLFLANTVFSANNLDHLLPGMGNIYKM